MTGRAAELRPAIQDEAAEAVARLPGLPARVFSKDGQVIDLTTSTWRARVAADGGRVVVFEWSSFGKRRGASVPVQFSDSTLALVKLYCVDRLTRVNASTALNDVQSFRHFAHWLSTDGYDVLSDARRAACAQPESAMLSVHEPLVDSTLRAGVPPDRPLEWAELTEGIARAYLAFGLRRDGRRGNDFHRLRSFWRWCLVREYEVVAPCVSPAVVRALTEIRAPGNAKGAAVRFRDPVRGPLTHDEVRLLVTALVRSDGQPHDRAAVMLHLELGCNPLALARLRNADLIVHDELVEGGVPHTVHAEPFHALSDGLTFFQLDLPRMKKRTTGRETKRRPISGRLGSLLLSLREGASDAPLLPWLGATWPEHALCQSLARFARDAGLVSPRTGAPLHLSPRRLRYTLATQIAEEGGSDVQIAEVLDHSDLQHVRVYTEATSRIADRVAEATDAVMTPIVARFLGRVDTPTRGETTVGAVSRAVIPAVAPHIGLGGAWNDALEDAQSGPRTSVQQRALESSARDESGFDLGLGRCGRDVDQDGVCRLLPPLACYVCPQFIAFRAGPHERVLMAIDQLQPQTAATPDRRIPAQLGAVREAVTELLVQIGRAPQG